MKERFKDTPQIKPYICAIDGTGLPVKSCDLAFLFKTYHHLNKWGHVDYLQHLHKFVKPTGRVCIIERHPTLVKIRHCFFKADESKMVNCVWISATTQHIETPNNANNNHPINQSGFCCQD